MKQLEKSLPRLRRRRRCSCAPSRTPTICSEDLVTAITDRAFIGDDALPRTQQEFEAQEKRARTRLPAVREAACRLFAAIADEYHSSSLKLGGSGRQRSRASPPTCARNSRGSSTRASLSATPWEQLAHLPRYLKAMAAAARQICARSRARREARGKASRELWKRYEERCDKQRKAGAVDPRLEEFRWQIEELRVSLFAQELKTPYPVSYKRLDKIWNAMR